MKRYIFIFVLGLLIFGCGSKRKALEKRPENKTVIIGTPEPVGEVSESEDNSRKSTTPVANRTTVYIDAYKAIAMEEMRIHKIPASITLAQGILESGSGQGRLAVKANNHFGIKCHDWTGKKIYHDDDRSQECFRKYRNSDQSFKDHSDFLVNRKRYSNLFRLKIDDYRGWARELRRAGYATDKRYPQKLIDLIERYDLYKYDDLVLGVKSRHDNTYIVNKGDTLYSISRRFNVSVEELQDWNKLEGTDLSVGQILRLTSANK
jgi:LysM repeat protein